MKHGISLCNCLIALHHLTGADYTSKVGMKHAALVAESQKYLVNFAQGMIYVIYV